MSNRGQKVKKWSFLKIPSLVQFLIILTAKFVYNNGLFVLKLNKTVIRIHTDNGIFRYLLMELKKFKSMRPDFVGVTNNSPLNPIRGINT